MFRRCNLLLLLNVLGIFGDHISLPYIKQGHIYSRLVEYDGVKPTITQGYVEIASNALTEYKNGKTSADALNKFSIGLEQYFSLKVYQKYELDIIEKPYQLVNVSDPIPLPDVKFEDISFYKAEAFGHPLYKHKIDPVHDGLTSPYQYSVKVASKSDVIIFTGYFDINETPYYFVYDLKGTTYEAIIHRVRGYIKPISVKIALDFVNEDLIHTYDSTYENYEKINELIQKKVINAVEQVYLPYLDKYNYKETSLRVANKDVYYMSNYRKLTISALIESVVNYINGKGLATFEIKPLNFTNPVGNKVFVQTYTDIKIRGILNFVKTEIGKSLIELLEDSKEYKISEDVEFYYPQDGEKLAFIEFIVGDGKHLVPKKFKIKSIKIIAVYNASVDERPVKVRRNKEVFLNNSGFLIKFDVENYDPAYEFLFRHVGNDISRAIENVLAAEGA